MTTDTMNFRDLVEKAPDADLLREMIGFAAERLMELEVGAVTGAAYGEKDPARRAHPARHVAHQHALPRGGGGIGKTNGTKLTASVTECVQPGRTARVRSLPGMRHRPRTPLRSTRP